jgi:hypothetical protein
MTPGQLVKAISVALDIPQETIAAHDRALQLGGMRTTGGRGLSAAQVTSLDAARLMTATLAAPRIKDSVSTVQSYEHARRVPRFVSKRSQETGQLTKREQERQDLENIFADLSFIRLPDGHSFVEALESIITDAVYSLRTTGFEDLKKRFAVLSITCERPGTCATIDRFTRHLRFEYRFRRRLHKRDLEAMSEAVRGSKPKPDLADIMMSFGNGGVRQQSTIYGAAIMLLAKAFHENGLDRFDSPEQAIRHWTRSDAKAGKPREKAA